MSISEMPVLGRPDRPTASGTRPKKKRAGVTSALQRLVGPKVSPVLYIVVGLIITMLQNAAYEFLRMSVDPFVMALLATALFAAMTSGVWMFSKRPPEVEIGPAPKKRGLVALVSQRAFDENPAKLALDYQLEAGQLEYVALIHSVTAQGNAPRTSKAVAEQLKEGYGSAHPGLRIELFPVQDHFDPDEVISVAQQAYGRARRLGLSADDVLADVTGGTVPMSIGLAFQARLQAGSLQYLKPRGLPGPGSGVEPIEIGTGGER